MSASVRVTENSTGRRNSCEPPAHVALPTMVAVYRPARASPGTVSETLNWRLLPGLVDADDGRVNHSGLAGIAPTGSRPLSILNVALASPARVRPGFWADA